MNWFNKVVIQQFGIFVGKGYLDACSKFELIIIKLMFLILLY